MKTEQVRQAKQQGEWCRRGAAAASLDMHPLCHWRADRVLLFHRCLPAYLTYLAAVGKQSWRNHTALRVEEMQGGLQWGAALHSFSESSWGDLSAPGACSRVTKAGWFYFAKIKLRIWVWETPSSSNSDWAPVSPESKSLARGLHVSQSALAWAVQNIFIYNNKFGYWEPLGVRNLIPPS